MSDVFLHVCNLALTAGWVALLVIAARLLLHRAPRRVSCLLWALVGLRLVLPVSFPYFFSLIPSTTPLPEDIAIAPVPQIESGFAAVDRVVNPVLSEHLAPAVGDSINPMQILLAIGAYIWLLGVAAMLIWAAVSYLRIRRRVRISLQSERGVYLCDDIDTPFILGVVRPRIYLPSTLSDEAADYVIAHERAHLRRLDHIWKPLGFLLLSIYWFHPLLWIAYIWLCRDIEAACDERVIRDMDGGNRKHYSEALLHCSVRGKILSACPLAFGEVGVKARVRAVLNYKKPAFWLLVAAVILSVFLALGLLSDPWQTPTDLLEVGTTWATEDGVLELTVHENFEILGTLTVGDAKHAVRLLYREQYAEICGIDDPDGDAPLLKCGIRLRGRRLHLLVREDTIGLGDTRLLLQRDLVTDPTISQVLADIHSEYEGIYLTIDTISTLSINVLEESLIPYMTLNATWHNDTDDVEITYGEPYAIDYWNGSEWIDLTPPNMAFTLPGYLLSPGESREKEYSTLPFDMSRAGRYRLRCSFSIEDLPYKEWVKTQNNYETWVEFTVRNDTYGGVQAETDTQLAVLREQYPEYFGLDTSQGLIVYVWMMAPDTYYCGLVAKGSNDVTSLTSLHASTIEQMRVILASYDLLGDQISVEQISMSFSSYSRVMTEVELWNIKAMLGIEGYSAIYDTSTCDLDGDGVLECISVGAGPTSGLFSFRLTVQDAKTGQQEYAGVFFCDAMKLSLKQQNGKLYLCGTELNRGEEHRYDVTMKDGVVSITEGGVPIGGEMGE